MKKYVRDTEDKLDVWSQYEEANCNQVRRTLRSARENMKETTSPTVDNVRGALSDVILEMSQLAEHVREAVATQQNNPSLRRTEPAILPLAPVDDMDYEGPILPDNGLSISESEYNSMASQQQGDKTVEQSAEEDMDYEGPIIPENGLSISESEYNSMASQQQGDKTVEQSAEEDMDCANDLFTSLRDATGYSNVLDNSQTSGVPNQNEQQQQQQHLQHCPQLTPVDTESISQAPPQDPTDNPAFENYRARNAELEGMKLDSDYENHVDKLDKLTDWFNEILIQVAASDPTTVELDFTQWEVMARKLMKSIRDTPDVETDSEAELDAMSPSTPGGNQHYQVSDDAYHRREAQDYQAAADAYDPSVPQHDQTYVEFSNGDFPENNQANGHPHGQLMGEYVDIYNELVLLGSSADDSLEKDIGDSQHAYSELHKRYHGRDLDDRPNDDMLRQWQQWAENGRRLLDQCLQQNVAGSDEEATFNPVAEVAPPIEDTTNPDEDAPSPARDIPKSFASPSRATNSIRDACNMVLRYQAKQQPEFNDLAKHLQDDELKDRVQGLTFEIEQLIDSIQDRARTDKPMSEIEIQQEIDAFGEAFLKTKRTIMLKHLLKRKNQINKVIDYKPDKTHTREKQQHAFYSLNHEYSDLRKLIQSNSITSMERLEDALLKFEDKLDEDFFKKKKKKQKKEQDE